MEQQRQRRLLKQQIEADERHVETGQKLQEWAIARLEQLGEDDLTPGRARLLLKAGAELERSALRIPSEITDATVHGDIRVQHAPHSYELTDEERKAAETLRASVWRG